MVKKPKQRLDKVYIIMWHDYEEDGIISVHSTIEEAEKKMKTRKEWEMWSLVGYDIEGERDFEKS